ncbi:trehalose-6-phosphate synthase [Bdellovibrionota bacterium FG-2]
MWVAQTPKRMLPNYQPTKLHAISSPASEALARIIVIANREPYIHENIAGQTTVLRPASGLVSALEPVLREHGGVWIAHGSGSEDSNNSTPLSEACGELPVPPERPKYQLRRVWLSAEEEQGYYYGFANEGLWPLCHLAHIQPRFRLNDWQHYKTVNQRFAECIPKNSGDLILVQDYHFALLPRILREHHSNPIALFWHIPWPHSEAFKICPWGKDLLFGMLGADVIGFHTQQHCENFLQSCKTLTEARINWNNSSVNFGGQETLIRVFPIGIDTTPIVVMSEEEKSALRRKYKIVAPHIAIGVDRIDYTKGLPERLDAIERFFEKNPEQIGQVTYVEMASPSRSSIPAYKNLLLDIQNRVRNINTRFAQASDDPTGAPAYKPIVFLSGHFEWDEVQRFYQLGEVCLVTSLHDGMNLVAKEYVWCQRPEQGCLILSQFTGAAEELSESLLVNPYDTEHLADALLRAFKMPITERTQRMVSMKEKIHRANAHHWAKNIIETLVKTCQ